MPGPCVLYYITDRTAFAGDELARRRALLAKIREAASAGVDFIQLREKDLHGRELESLAGEAARIVRDANLRTENRQARTGLLVNSRTDLALATGAAGVHLRSDDLSPQEVRSIWTQSSPGGSGAPARVTIGISCHSTAEVERAGKQDADFAVFAPVFEKQDVPTPQAAGLEALRDACRHKIPVLALGGVTLENFGACLEAGAAGIAAIRLFQENDVAEIVRRIRGR
jgi:thiamine-phosphate pyrophosphorylase